jgi:hypothetical protein
LHGDCRFSLLAAIVGIGPLTVGDLAVIPMRDLTDGANYYNTKIIDGYIIYN